MKHLHNELLHYSTQMQKSSGAQCAMFIHPRSIGMFEACYKSINHFDIHASFFYQTNKSFHLHILISNVVSVF